MRGGGRYAINYHRGDRRTAKLLTRHEKVAAAEIAKQQRKYHENKLSSRGKENCARRGGCLRSEISEKQKQKIKRKSKSKSK